MKLYLKIVLLMLVGFGATSALAVPVQWTLQNMTFSNGSTATGSFVFDVDTSTFSNISISVTASTDPAALYYAAGTFNEIVYGSSGGGYFTTLPLWFNTDIACNSYQCGTHILSLVTVPHPMSNVGGVGVTRTVTAALGYCAYGICNSGIASANWATSVLQTGSITAVPEAKTYAMMLAGLGLVGFMARRREQVES